MSRDLLTASEREFADCLLDWYEEAQLDRTAQFSISAEMVCRLHEAFERLAPKPEPMSLANELYLAAMEHERDVSDLPGAERARFERMAEAMRVRGAK